jgi:hypothetical protein
MLIIWKRMGWLVPVVFFSVFFLFQVSFDAIYSEGFYKENQWVKNTAIIFGGLCLALLGYFLNHKKRHLSTDTDKPISTDKHTFFFIPIEFWAIILPVLFTLIQINDTKNDTKDYDFIQAPVVNDKYLSDFTKFFPEIDEDYKYGVLRVVSVQAEGVQVDSSRMAYSAKSGAKKDIRENKADNAKYYSNQIFFIKKQALFDYKDTGKIIRVFRSEK